MRTNHDHDWGRRAEDVAAVIRWAKEQAHSVSGTGGGNRSSKPPSGTGGGNRWEPASPADPENPVTTGREPVAGTVGNRSVSHSREPGSPPMGGTVSGVRFREGSGEGSVLSGADGVKGIDPSTGQVIFDDEDLFWHQATSVVVLD